MYNIGWIKLHRKFTEKGYYKKSQYVHLWIHILLKANHKPNEFFWNGENIKIETGQFLTGRKELWKETGISESTIENILKFFESEHQIEQQKTTKFRIITVKKWENYQLKDNDEHQIEQQGDNNVTTERQQNDNNVTQYKNIKKIENDNNEKNDKTEIAKTLDFEKVLQFWNVCAKELNIPEINSVTDKRKQMILSRSKEKEFDMKLIIEEISKSDFLRGLKGDFKVTFDWIFKSKNNYIKIIEGNYRNGSTEQNNGTGDKGFDIRKNTWATTT